MVTWHAVSLSADLVKAISSGELSFEDAREQIAEPQEVTPVIIRDDSAIKSLAAQIERAVEAAQKAEQPAPIWNMTMPAINLTAQMPPNGTVTVNVPEQAAPIVNVITPETTVNVSPTPVTIQQPINQVIVQPAEVILPPLMTEATIKTDKKTGDKTLKVKK